MSSDTNVAVESAKDFDSPVARWTREIELSEKENRDWWTQCRKIDIRYRDKRDSLTENTSRFNVLWSNVQTLLPAIYAKPPEPVVQRRFRDSDPVARAACTILSRNLDDAIEETELHGTMRQVTLDYLLAARGTAWIRYEPHFAKDEAAAAPIESNSPESPSVESSPGDMPDDQGLQVADDGEEAGEIVTWEEVCCDYIHYEDFLHSPAKVWQDVTWVARRARMTRDEGVKRFGKKFKDVSLNWRAANAPEADDGTPEHEAFKRATVFEIWDKPSRKVIWIAQGYTDDILDERDDPLKLRKFFPTPKPLFGTLTNNSLVPVPDYVEYQDQAMELDDLTGRISAVTKAIRVAGVYDAAEPALARILEEGGDGKLIPIEDWARFAKSGGGIEGAINLLPMADLVNVLKVLMEARDAAKALLYEETGIADILRGATAPQETATAQRIKGRYATMRLSDRQTEVARYVRDLLRLMAEVIATHFSAETLALASNWQASELAQDYQPPQMPGQPPVSPQQASQMLLQQALGLLKDDKLRGFRVDIEDQSTIAADDDAEKGARVEFLEAVGKFLQSAIAIPPNMAPAMGPMLGKMLLFAVRGFNAGSELESAMEEAVAKMQQSANTPPPPDPKMIEAQANAQKAQAEAQAATQQGPLDQAKMQLEQQKMQQAQAQQQKQNEQDDRQHMIDVARLQSEAEERQYQRQKDDQDHQVELLKLAMDQRKLELEQSKHQVDTAHRSRELALAESTALSTHQKGVRDSDTKDKQVAATAAKAKEKV